MSTHTHASAVNSDLVVSIVTEVVHEGTILNFDFHKAKEITVTIKNTPTFCLLDRRSHTAEQTCEKGRLIEKLNQYYEHLNAGKGRFRVINYTKAQTTNVIKKTAMTVASTTWGVQDTNSDMDKTSNQREMQFVKKEVGDNAATREEYVEDRKMRVVAEALSNKGVNLPRQEQFESLAKSETFLNACARMERLLASNVYRNQQKTFRGLMQPDQLRLDVKFRYRVELLWSFTSDYVRGRTVAGMCWNPLNTDLLAVGYGKYFHQDRKNGLVCCWTIKNPIQPERKYKFDNPVTAVNFSTCHPNLLACGFYNGSVIILDISFRTKTIIAASNREMSPSYEPVWQIFWLRGEDNHQTEEQLVTCCQDGRICRYRREKNLHCFSVTLVTRVEGKVKGIDQSRKFRAHDIPVTRHPAALVLTKHPVETLTYFIGTDEGCIHKFSIDLHQHTDIFTAHDGPVYSMQFSPFCSKIFLTCGADWCIRIWSEGVGQPLLTLNSSMEAIQGAVWSPVNATIIASISGNNIHFWDIRRKICDPVSTTTSPTKSRNLVVQFTSSGLNLVVGDSDGTVHVYGLQDMPFSPFYQETALIQSIKNALLTRPELLTTLKKIGKPFY